MGEVTCWALQCRLWTAECTARAAEEGSTQAAAGGSWGPSTLPFLFMDLTPSAGIFKRYFVQQSSQAFWKAGHVCALTSQPGKAGAARAGKPSGDCTRVCCQHKCAICPLCTAVEYLHVLQPHLQLHCRHILRVITGGCVSGLYLISKK